MTTKLVKILAVVLALLFLAPPILSHAKLPSTANAQTEFQGFYAIDTAWGTPTSPAEPNPGDRAVPLTLTLEYLFQYAAINTQITINMPPGFSSSTNGANSSIQYGTGEITFGTLFKPTFYLDLSSNLTLGTYVFPTTILWNAILSNTTNSPETYLEQNLNITVTLSGGSKLAFSTNQISLVPGEVNNVPISLANDGTGNATNISTTVSTSSQLASIIGGFPFIQELGPGQVVTDNVSIFVAPTASGSPVSITLAASYLDPYQNEQSLAQTLGLFSSGVTRSPLDYRILQNSLIPGEVNNVTLTVTNNGAQVLSGISTEVTSSSPSLSILSQVPTIPQIMPGSQVPINLTLFVSVSASNTAVTLVFAYNCVTGSGLEESFTENVGTVVGSSSSASSGQSISVTTLDNSVASGQPSTVSFRVTDMGNLPIYYPSFSLSTAQPSSLVVTDNSTYSTVATIGPNKSVVYEATIMTAPSLASGVYGGSLTISYQNQYGISFSQVFQVGFIVTGTTEIVIQDEQITQGSGNLTVSGTLLNEGTAPAYYASVAGYTNASSRHVLGPLSYIGEVDPNTPVPFTATVPFTVRGAVSTLAVTLVISFRDSFGRNLTSQSTPVATTLAPGVGVSSPSGGTTGNTSTATSGGQLLVKIVLYAIIAAVAVSMVVGAIAIRRRRRSPGSVNSEAGAEKGENQKQDSKVV